MNGIIRRSCFLITAVFVTALLPGCHLPPPDFIPDESQLDPREITGRAQLLAKDGTLKRTGWDRSHVAEFNKREKMRSQQNTTKDGSTDGSTGWMWSGYCATMKYATRYHKS